jgi:hypothetical protein
MNSVTKLEVIRRLCLLASEVGTMVYNDESDHDCFCSIHDEHDEFRFDEEVIAFIESTVRQAIIERY